MAGMRDEEREGPRWSAVRALITSAVVSVGVLGMSVVFLGGLVWFTPDDSTEAALSLVFVAATVVLVLVVSALAIVLKRLGLTDRREAMGLPPGSIRAVIALLLIMLFFIAAIFIFNRSHETFGESDLRPLEGLSTAQYAALDPSSIRSSEQVTVDGEISYNVVLYPPSTNTQTSDDIAKQLVTTVGTLVTAVAAFYFGSASIAHRPRREIEGDGQPEPEPEPEPDAAEPGAAEREAPDAEGGAEGGTPRRRRPTA